MAQALDRRILGTVYKWTGIPEAHRTPAMDACVQRPARYGGMGILGAEEAMDAAWVASAALVGHKVISALDRFAPLRGGNASIPARLERAFPGVLNARDRLGRLPGVEGSPLEETLRAVGVSGQKGLQKTLMDLKHAAGLARVFDAAEGDKRDWARRARSQAGRGAMAWTQARGHGEDKLENESFALLFKLAVYAPTPVGASEDGCRVCGVAGPHNDKGEHVLRCGETKYELTYKHTALLKFMVQAVRKARPDLRVTTNPVMKETRGFTGKTASILNLEGDMLIETEAGLVLAAVDVVTASLHGGEDAHLQNGVCARVAERVKRTKYKSHLVYEDNLFVPFAVESGGTIGPAGLALVDLLWRDLPDKTLAEKASSKADFFRGLSVVAQRANASKFLAYTRQLAVWGGRARLARGRVAG